MDLTDLETLDVDQFRSACPKKVDGQVRFSILPRSMNCLLVLPHPSAGAERGYLASLPPLRQSRERLSLDVRKRGLPLGVEERIVGMMIYDRMNFIFKTNCTN